MGVLGGDVGVCSGDVRGLLPGFRPACGGNLYGTAVRTWISVLLAVLLGYGGYWSWRVSRMAKDGRAESAAVTPTSAGATPRPWAVSVLRIPAARNFPSSGWTEGLGGEFLFRELPWILPADEPHRGGIPDGVGRAGGGVCEPIDRSGGHARETRRIQQNAGVDPASWSFLTGDFADVQELGQDVFEVTVTGKADHSDRLILVVRRGNPSPVGASLDPRRSQFKRRFEAWRNRRNGSWHRGPGDEGGTGYRTGETGVGNRGAERQSGGIGERPAVTVADLPLVNASLDVLATGLLLWGFRLIRQRREVAHRRVMLAAFAVSTVFLGSYLTYHFATTAVRKFTGPAPRSTCYAILVSHVLLAMTVPVLAVLAIVLGLRDRGQPIAASSSRPGRSGCTFR